MRRALEWYLRRVAESEGPWALLLWWEKRRIALNAIIGLYGVVALLVFLVALGTSGHLEPGEDAVEPLAIMAAPFGVNALYCLGWLVSVPMRIALRHSAPHRENVAMVPPFLLGAGTCLGLFLISVPPVVWVSVRVLQIIGLLENGTA